MAQRLANRAHEAEREEGRTRAKQLAPTGRPQRAESERESAREGKAAADRRRGRTGARPNWAELCCFSFFFFSGFSNFFSIGFSIPNSN
jgi:hypothetical protein